MAPGSIATAAAWHPSGRYATCSLELSRRINGVDVGSRTMFDTGAQKPHRGRRPYSDTAYLNIMQQQGHVVTTTIRYNAKASHLLSVSTNGKRGLLEIWDGCVCPDKPS